uniref:Uncharacterized protein n=1 Tax=Candidatus Kentrum sp. MB TaxID=2138164 RepID=A0A450XL24_9GAMM|nr:MAG: hypothetical protein BECKMB1821I_GA0114274_101320 [Candidatus Kentron sp. MB]
MSHRHIRRVGIHFDTKFFAESMCSIIKHGRNHQDAVGLPSMPIFIKALIKVLIKANLAFKNIHIRFVHDLSSQAINRPFLIVTSSSI